MVTHRGHEEFDAFADALVSLHKALTSGHTTDARNISVEDTAGDGLQLEIACLEDLELLRRGQQSASHAPKENHGSAIDADPHTMDRFRIEGELGRGGCGVVFLANDPRLGRRVALKIPRPDVLFSREMKARFVREGRTAAVLNHPGIIAVYEAGQVGGICYIASEYCAGPTLSTWLAGSRHDVPQQLAAKLVADLADAVDHAHRHGILHRDLKPGNVLLVPDDSVSAEFPYVAKLTDFGLAKLMEEDEESAAATRTGALLGTPAYMSPEQANGQTREIGTHSDVYALGVILYELLTRRAPFMGGSDVETLRRIVEKEPTRPSAMRRSISRDLEAICLKCLEKDPGKRYSSSAELAADLRRFVAGELTLARPTSPSARALKWVRRNPTAAGFMTFVVMALLAGAAGLTTYSIKQKQFNTELSAALETADQARLRSEQSERRLQERVYAADMKLAGQALAENDVRQVRTFLGRHVPKSRERDLRDFTWYYLSKQVSQQPLTEFHHPGAVYKAAYSPDGQWLSTACADGHARIWDPKSPEQPVIDIATRHGECNCASFDQAGGRLATTGDDRAIRIWDLETQTLLHTINDAHEGMGYNALFTNDGKHVVSCGEDSYVRMWDVASGELVREWENHPGHICEALSHSPDRNAIASVGSDAWLILLSLTEDPASPELARRQLNYAHLHPTLRDLAYTRAGIFAVNAMGSLYQYLTDTDTVLEFHRLFRDEPRTIAANDDGLIVVGDTNGYMTRLRVEGDRTVRLRSFMAHTDRVWSLMFHPAGDRFVSCSDDGLAKVYSTAFAPVASWEIPLQEIRHLDCLPDGDVAIARGDSHFELLRLDKNSGEVKVQRELDDEFNGLACRPDGKRLAVSSQNQNAIWIFDADSLEGVASFAANQPCSGVYSADGEKLAYIDRENHALVVVDSMTGEEFARVPEVDAVVCVASPKGCSFASMHEGSIVLFDADRRQQRRWEAQRTLSSLAFTPDGKRLVSAGERDLRLWDVTTGRLIRTFEGHRNYLLKCDISPDGRTLASGDMEEMKLWSIATGQEVLTVPRGTIAIQFQQNGRRIVRVDVKYRLVLFDVEPQD